MLGGEGEVLVYSLLPVRPLAALDLGQGGGQPAGQVVRVALAQNFIITVLTVSRKMQVRDTV